MSSATDAELAYSATFNAGPATLTVPRHDGGGVDEDANVLWAIERRVDGVELVEPDEPTAPPPAVAPANQIVVTGTRRYR